MTLLVALQSFVSVVVGLLVCWLLCSALAGAFLWLRLRSLGGRDQLTVGPFGGRLVGVGPLRLELEQSGGGRVLLPNLVALFRPLVTQRENESAPVTLHIQLPALSVGGGDSQRELLRVLHAAAILAPYRDGRAPVESLVSDNVAELQLSLTRLSCRDEMEHYLRSRLRLFVEASTRDGSSTP